MLVVTFKLIFKSACNLMRFGFDVSYKRLRYGEIKWSCSLTWSHEFYHSDVVMNFIKILETTNYSPVGIYMFKVNNVSRYILTASVTDFLFKENIKYYL